MRTQKDTKHKCTSTQQPKIFKKADKAVLVQFLHDIKSLYFTARSITQT